MTPLETLLDSYRTAAISERDKGMAFEKLIAAWLPADPVQAQRIATAELWSDWARHQGQDRSDTGIDLVATRHDGGLVAVQCKFFARDRRIRKEDIDSFISASGKHGFAERLIVETTEAPWSDQARSMLDGQAIPVTRVGLHDLMESRVDWSAFAARGEIVRPEPKTLRPDQIEAVEAVRNGLARADRGKIIMACGTGKTLIGLRTAEELAGTGRHVLVLVPSLALMSQTVPEWCADAVLPLTAFAVCSDRQVGKRRRSIDDVAELEVTDLAFPATTDREALAREVGNSAPDAMRVVFATYQSIPVIADAQATYGLPEFDLIVCDEAHRTTGVKFPGEDQSNFMKVHDNTVIRGSKRLYMTATPRIYGEVPKSKAQQMKAVLASMDDPEQYGEVLFHHGFARAVESNILSDYRVVVLAMDEGQVSAAVQKRLASEYSGELLLDDATKIVGCWKALSKAGLSGGTVDDAGPMHRALAFCNSIAKSKLVRDEFEQVVAEFQEESGASEQNGFVCQVRHVDGTYNARDRRQRLDWLKEDAGVNTCRILSNARCLTEGVDIPALDAILFLHPRNSQIDVVQAVGRVMRKAPGKNMGYVILPVGIPPDTPAEQALSDNKRYRVVWQILNALRAHDERLDAVINQGGLGQDVRQRIAIIDGRTSANDPELDAVTAKIEDLPNRPGGTGSGIGKGGGPSKTDDGDQITLDLVIDDFSRAVMAKIVEKCGTREYWEDWAKDVASIAERHITRIESLVDTEGSDAQVFFRDFLKELRDDLNESVSERDAIEMLAQHLITRPVFDALFEGHAFINRNPVSNAMNEILSVIDEAGVSQEAKELEGFYASVRRRAEGISDPTARQNLVVELYDKFFRGAFPRTTRMLGIVYTPVEIVDFIIHSVNDALKEEFGQTLGSEGVHVIDPFTGTGTFITRLLQSGLIGSEELERKYRWEIHANDIVLLAYYIAAINIETVFHAVAKREAYLPFEGICLTDTFALHEQEDLLSFYMKDNSSRRERQKETDIRVIIGNPPWSAGQKSENANEKNVAYAGLDHRIRETWAKRSKASNSRNLYDSYIRAIRWASDRLGDAGVMAFVSNAGWLDGNAMDGMRKCLAEEFSNISVFHLRGNQRTQGELSRMEGGKVFGSGSRAPVAITVLVRNPEATEQGRILYHDIGDGLNRQQKLDIIRGFGSIDGIAKTDGWTRIAPDEHGDWLDQRNQDFERFLKIGEKKDKTGNSLFQNYSLGAITKRDAWCINPSLVGLSRNIKATIEFYNLEVARWLEFNRSSTSVKPNPQAIDSFVSSDLRKISWSPNLKSEFRQGRKLSLKDGQFVTCMYRPFTKQWQFYSRRFNDRVHQLPRIFPNGELPNRVIAVSGKGARAGFSALMMDALPNLHTIDSGQCFPFWLYENQTEKANDAQRDFLEDAAKGYRRTDAITDFAIRTFRSAYPSETITREDIFHYIYGLLHSEDYRTRFSANLAKELPRIPLVNSLEDYRAIRDAGQRLGELHVDYENVHPWDGCQVEIEGAGELPPETLYRVEKMRHPGKGKNKDRSTVILNRHITIREIPEMAWDYVVNGKPALAWVMERQAVKTEKASGIVSDANRYAVETVGDPRYPLDLLLRIITVSLETITIVRDLPSLEQVVARASESP